MTMNVKKYRKLRVLVIFFVSAIVGLSVSLDSYLLSSIGVFTGMVFLVLVRLKTKTTIDEREKTVREKAAQLTYAIFAPTIGIGTFILLIPSHSGLAVFAKGEFFYLESLGVVLAYLSLFLIALYAISYFFLNQKYGGGNEE